MKPLFIWAGGKTKVLKHYAPFMPSSFDTYYEPFFGGGAMFVHVMNTYKPSKVIINDINDNVMNIYRCIRDNYDEFLVRLNELEDRYLYLTKEDRKKLYFEVRHQHAYDYADWDVPYEAATLYFLMKTGFNGIWQINKNTNGRYGTPAGLLNQRIRCEITNTGGIYSKEVLDWWHNALQVVDIKSGDWKDAVTNDPNGFFFFDPPYRDSFADYGNGFGDDALTDLLDFADAQNLVFVANRADDDWFNSQSRSMNVHYFDITYTAGRRKKTDDGFAAKKAREILLYKTNRVTVV